MSTVAEMGTAFGSTGYNKTVVSLQAGFFRWCEPQRRGAFRKNSAMFLPTGAH